MAGNAKGAKAAREASGEMTTKERIFDVAIDLFAQKGFDAVSLREIAEAAGIRKATLYYYFTTKDEMLEKILEYVLERWNQSKVGKWSDSDETEKQIVAMGLDGFMAMASGVSTSLSSLNKSAITKTLRSGDAVRTDCSDFVSAVV